MNNNILIGRDAELKLINDFIAKKENVMIFGEKGTGKSELVRTFVSGKNAGTYLFSKESKDIKDSFANLAISGGYKKNIREQNIDALKTIFYGLISKTPEFVVFDNLGRVKPKFNSFLNYLIDKKIPLLITCRGLEKQHIGHLRWVSFAFNTIELTNFDKKNSCLLIDFFIKEFDIKTEKADEFKHDIIKYSGGNPGLIKALCMLARDQKYNKNGSFDMRLMELDRKINEVIPSNNA